MQPVHAALERGELGRPFTAALVAHKSPQRLKKLGYTHFLASLQRRAELVDADRCGHATPVLRAPRLVHPARADSSIDRKSTRLNSSHMSISYAVFCLKKKKKK